MKEDFIRIGNKILRKCIIDSIWIEERQNVKIFVKDKSGEHWSVLTFESRDEAESEIKKIHENL